MKSVLWKQIRRTIVNCTNKKTLKCHFSLLSHLLDLGSNHIHVDHAVVGYPDELRVKRRNLFRYSHNKVSHILSFMKDEVVSLGILSKKTDIFPLIYIMLYLRFLN